MSGQERDDCLSLWWRRPLRTRRREPTKDGLQKCPLNGRRYEGLESRRITNDEAGRYAANLKSDYVRRRFASSIARYSSRGGLNVSRTRASSIVSTPCGTLLAR